MARHRASPLRPLRPRWFTAAASAIAVVVIALAAYLAVGTRGRTSGDASTGTSVRAPCAAACGSTEPGAGARSGPARSPAPSPSRSQPRSSPHPGRTGPPATPGRARTSTPADPPAPPPGGSSADSNAEAVVLATINQARAQAGLAPYTIEAGLVTSAGEHNMLMADGCGLSHQCAGEPALGQRETDAGVQWTAAGENIGGGGPVADTTAAITRMASELTRDMINEKPPDDGHRLNILSSTFTHIGIVVYRSSDGTVWMTQDLAN